MSELIERILCFGFTKDQAQAAYVFGYRVAIISIVVAGWGGLSWIGVPQFAVAGDVDHRLSETQAMLLGKIAEQQKVVNATSDLLKRQLANSIAAQIRTQALKRCKATTIDKEQVNREIDRLQEEYAEYRGINYSIPGCTDL